MSLVSVRMRASYGGLHVSGAERIVEEESIPQAVEELLKRPKRYDYLKITLERLKRIEYIETSLPVKSFSFAKPSEARVFALELLHQAGVEREIAKRGIELLSCGANPTGGNMRGAVLMDVESGNRLEPSKERGIRTVRVDWENRAKVKGELLELDMTERTLDALAIATKNLNCGVIAELCWSDDPDYTTGYVASLKLGYVRLSPLKDEGDHMGGRIYFIDSRRAREIIECLEKKAVLIKSLRR